MGSLKRIKNMFSGTKEEEKPDVASPSAANAEAAPASNVEAEEIDRMLSISKELNIPPINLSKYKIEKEALRLIPERLARAYQVIPLTKTGSVLAIVTSDPFNIVVIDTIKAIVKLDIQLVMSTPTWLTQAIDKYYTALAEEDSLKEDIVQIESIAEERIDVEEITRLSHDATVVKTVNDTLIYALGKRASDIHIEPYQNKIRLRYRIDGILNEMEQLPFEHYAAIIARVKILSGLDITQRRIPQDGRFSINIEKREVDFRVSILPLATGEKIVMRILEKGDLQVDLEKLGFSAYGMESFKKAVARPYGMILLTGPTGSGKSTTLYALLNKLNSSEEHLITIEDPVEYKMKGVTQIQVKTEIGLTFAGILRAVLRQSPDVIMVGEMRDFETADIAIKAALTGHIILSTLHTNDAPSAVTRLMNMGIEPVMISSTLTLIAAQRLCRRVCVRCKESYELPAGKAASLLKDVRIEKPVFYRGKGCPTCNNTGYFGRISIVEALLLDDPVRQMILQKASLSKITEYARAHGMKTLREDAFGKALSGEISLEEVLRVTPEE